MMNRRDLLIGAGAFALAATAGKAVAAGGHDHGHAHGSAASHQGVINTSLECVATGHLCIDHALREFSNGDTTLAECTRSIHELVAVCDTMAQLASYDSPHLKSYMKMAIEVCRQTEKECRKYSDKHKACRDCADSCSKCIGECEKALKG